MILLVDAGNTRIKWRIVSGRELRANGVVLTTQVATLEPFWRAHPLRGAVLSCVADAAARAGLAQLMASLRIVPCWVQPVREKYGLTNLYDAPEQLGADRYAALIAAARLQQRDCVVVSAGTATTVDMLGRNGVFLGGVIIPGADLMRAALLGGTGEVAARMRQAGSSAMPTAWPRDTDTAVAMGIALAQAGVVKAMGEMMCERLPGAPDQQPLVILTGGARDRLRDWLSNEVIEIEDLVLEGLAWIALDSNLAS